MLCMSFSQIASFPPLKTIPIFYFLLLHWHVFIVFFPPAVVTTLLPDAHKMGLSGKTFAPHLSHKGSLWPITVLMEARDSHQLHAFFSLSHAWMPAKPPVRSVSGVPSLAVALPMAVQRSGPDCSSSHTFRGVKGPSCVEGNTTSYFFLKQTK